MRGGGPLGPGSHLDCRSTAPGVLISNGPAVGGEHIHYTEGYVMYEDGHQHYYKAYSGPAIPVGNGMHVHYYDFNTTVEGGHSHRVQGVDMPAPGTK